MSGAVDVSNKQPNHLIVNFAPTGMVPTRDMTCHVPLTAAEIVEDVHDAYDQHNPSEGVTHRSDSPYVRFDVIRLSSSALQGPAIGYGARLCATRVPCTRPHVPELEHPVRVPH